MPAPIQKIGAGTSSPEPIDADSFLAGPLQIRSFRTMPSRIEFFRRPRWIAPLTASALLGILALAEPARAQQFSAELVFADVEGHPTGVAGKLRVASDRVRIETPDLPDGFLLVSRNPDAAYFVRPAQRVFMEAKQSSRLTQLFVTLDPEDPCPRWQAAAELARVPDPDAPERQDGLHDAPRTQWRCERIGRETIAGRDTIRYQAVLPQGGRRDGWIDPLLRFPLRIDADDGTRLALKNIVEAPQPATAFEIPSGYGKFDPRELIERIKKSDVWVEPPPR